MIQSTPIFASVLLISPAGLLLCTLAIAINTKCKVKMCNVLIPYTNYCKLLGEATTPCVFHSVLEHFLVFFCPGFPLFFQAAMHHPSAATELLQWQGCNSHKSPPLSHSSSSHTTPCTGEDGLLYRCCRGLCCNNLPGCFWQLL